MRSFHRQSLDIALILLACGQAAFGGTYRDPSDFAFTYPEGWVAVTRAAMGDVSRVIPDATRDWVLRNKVDLNQIEVVLLRDSQDEFLENINVLVKPQQIPANARTAKQLTEAMTQQYAELGVKLESIQGRVEKIGLRDAIVVRFQSRLPGVDETLRQKQVIIPGGGKTYIVTCTAKADTYDKYEPTFDEVLASFQTPAPIAQGFDWNQVGTSGAVGGIVGGMIAALAVAGRALGIKAKPKQKPESPEAEEV